MKTEIDTKTCEARKIQDLSELERLESGSAVLVTMKGSATKPRKMVFNGCRGGVYEFLEYAIYGCEGSTIIGWRGGKSEIEVSEGRVIITRQQDNRMGLYSRFSKEYEDKIKMLKSAGIGARGVQ